FSGGFPVIAVGDPDQTIYEWRGATPANFERFGTHFPHNDGARAEERSLTVNRRSDRRILAVANVIRAEIGPRFDQLAPSDLATEGEVAVRWTADAVVEADWIADQMIRLHEQGVPWSQMAVLFRKNRHIGQVLHALTNQEIPVEVANLGGLLSVPEVTDVRAWMRIIDAPEDGPALLRILMGPRFALGIGDLIHLTRWVDARNRQAENRQAGEQAEIAADHEQLPEHTMVEAIDQIDEVEGLDDRARMTLERFRSEFRRLLEYAQSASLAELTRTILDVTGAWHDVEAMGDAGRLSARLNLYRFLDLTEEWSPLEGRPSLAAFLGHLEMMEDNPADELDAARLSGEEAVGLLTVHRAKGLEWDVVFVPCVTRGNFPSKSTGFPDPYRSPQWLPHEWRVDDPPDFDADTPEKEAKAVLREDHLRQEWRTAYVAATRARHRLFVSGAHWYGATTPNQRPSVPSDLFTLVAGVDGVVNLGTDPEPERPEILRAPGRAQSPDPLFEDGWVAALRRATEAADSVAARAQAAGLAEQVSDRVAAYQERLFALESVPTTPVPLSPSSSVTGLVTYAACPRRHFWTEVDRLPRRPSPSARHGVEVHRRIELHGLGQVPLEMIEADDYDMVAVGGATRPADSATGPPPSPYSAYLGSRFASHRPIFTEVPFRFDTRAGLTVRGRIDAIYADDDAWEIVDFKSGRRRDDPWLAVQLEAYAVAAERVDFGAERPDRLAVSFVYLGSGVDVVRTEVDDRWMERATGNVESLAEGIVAEEFGPTPGAPCLSCEFVRFCPAGAQWLAERQP
ncbi:MAG: ATP-dependent DNA helicase, partial [Acidimicrobiia bacterium]